MSSTIAGRPTPSQPVRPAPRRSARAGQRGVAAVEFAVILPIMIIMLAFPLLYCRIFWHYGVAHKAAQDACMYLSTLPRQEMASQTQGPGAGALARQIVTTEIAEFHPGADALPVVDVYCDDHSCGGGATPAQTRVRVSVRINDDIFSYFTGMVTGAYGLEITADVRMNYVGI